MGDGSGWQCREEPSLSGSARKNRPPVALFCLSSRAPCGKIEGGKVNESESFY